MRPFRIASLLFLFSVAASAATLHFPTLTGRVVDAAAVLPPDARARLDALLAQHEANTGQQVVVATVPSLQGQAIEEYGVALGRAWGIGERKKNTGAILLVAPKEHEVRIEVGYGLEGVLTDAVSSQIINERIAPAFRQGDLPGGIERGARAIIAALNDPAAAAAAATKHKRKESAPGFFPLFMLLMGIWVLFSGLGRRRSLLYGGTLGGLGGWGGGGGGGGGFSGGGGSFGGGGASGRW